MDALPPPPGRDEIRAFELDRLNTALRRPDSCGGEVSLLLLMDALAFIDGARTEWQLQLDGLAARGASGAAGVRGVVRQLLPDYRADASLVSSVYADVAHQLGWLIPDHLLPDAEYRRLCRTAPEWTARDHDLDEALDRFGPPSVWFGGRNPRYGKALGYAGPDPSDPLVHLHFAGTYRWDVQPPPPETPPLLVAVRQGGGAFVESFAFTPHGLVRRAAPPR